MMNNLFSIFDPSALLMISFNWLSLALFLVAIPSSYWILSNPFKTLLNSILNALMKEFLSLLKSKKENTLIFVSLFTFILINNTMGLTAFTFTATSHLSITISLALPLWLAFIMYSLSMNMKNFLAHLVPTGTPPVLMPFMVIIEIISNVIRPITLSVRLAANMIAGHLLLTLLGNQLVTSSWLIMPGLISAEIMLMTLEAAVACIQAYVFSVLTTLYASEA